jgi:ADP-ribosylglycohydrolase
VRPVERLTPARKAETIKPLARRSGGNPRRQRTEDSIESIMRKAPELSDAVRDDGQSSLSLSRITHNHDEGAKTACQ